MTEHIRHLYVHIPFCARICPYCAFYKDLIDRVYAEVDPTTATIEG